MITVQKNLEQKISIQCLPRVRAKILLRSNLLGREGGVGGLVRMEVVITGKGFASLGI